MALRNIYRCGVCFETSDEPGNIVHLKNCPCITSPPPATPADQGSDGETEELRRRFIERVLLSVAEIPDRNSPDDFPEAMLVTGHELASILGRHLEGVPALLAKLDAKPAAVEDIGTGSMLYNERELHSAVMAEREACALFATLQAELLDDNEIAKAKSKDCGVLHNPDAMKWRFIASAIRTRTAAPAPAPVTAEGWISCKERMPPKNTWALVCDAENEVRTALFVCTDFIGDIVEPVRCWMLIPPLPAAPKVEG